MKKTAFWTSNAALGIAVTLLVIALAATTQWVRGLDLAVYDMAMRMMSVQPSDKIAIIKIDKQSLDAIGRWPWSRETHAEMIDKLAVAKPAAIGTTVFYAEPQQDVGLSYIKRITDVYSKAGGLDLQSVEVGADPIAEQPDWLGSVGPILREADIRLNSDRRLANSVRLAGNVVLPIAWGKGQEGGTGKVLPAFILRTQLSVVRDSDSSITSAQDLAVPVLEEIGLRAAAVGHFRPWRDRDGSVREEAVVTDVYGQGFPSLALAIAARAMSVDFSSIRVQAGESIKVGPLKMGTNADTRLHTLFYSARKDKPVFSEDSFHDVLNGKVAMEKYRDKIVLIGATVPDVGSVEATPVDGQMAGVRALAHKVSNLLKGHFIARPWWGKGVMWLLLILAALYISLLLPRLNRGLAVATTAGLILAIVISHFVLMTQKLMWIELMLPACLLLAGHAALSARRVLSKAIARAKPAPPVDTNRILAIALQGQGHLDTAFDKFKLCELDEELMHNLYKLGLDFERKQQHSKAEAVFRYMADFNPRFRDLEQRLQRAKQMNETMILGAGGGQGNPGGAALAKPVLGRYQIEKTLGRGAMGAVYLGRDPKMNRVVAIKTLALSEEFAEEDLAEVKERFFREAETAGRLNHPNIVTMYDAGEENDLAYIAMEFLKGSDLTPYITAGKLLAADKVIGIVARIADALAYAHKNNVVHRDIKPANIMYDPESDLLKVTDFGIARITDSTRTRTGMVLGTPSYMSPEQLAGQKIDGRSDIFSLGVMLYQLLSGVLPFSGESMGQLMQRIANEPHIDVRTYNPGINEALAAVVDRALVKDLKHRYQAADEMARDLRRLGASQGKDAAAVDFLL